LSSPRGDIESAARHAVGRARKPNSWFISLVYQGGKKKNVLDHLELGDVEQKKDSDDRERKGRMRREERRQTSRGQREGGFSVLHQMSSPLHQLYKKKNSLDAAQRGPSGLDATGCSNSILSADMGKEGEEATIRSTGLAERLSGPGGTGNLWPSPGPSRLGEKKATRSLGRRKTAGNQKKRETPETKKRRGKKA